MTIDPDDYDLRELRRIADERRDTRQSEDVDQSENGRRRRGSLRRHGHQSDDARRNGKEPSRNGRSAKRSGTGRQEQPSDGPGADEVTVRPRNADGQPQDADGRPQNADDQPQGADDRPRDASGRSRNVNSRPRDANGRPRDANGRPRDANGRLRRGDPKGGEHDGVVRADRIARDIGFGDEGESQRHDGRVDRRRERRLRLGVDGRPRAGRDGDDVSRFQFDTEVRERPRDRPGRALRENQLEQLLVRETAASEALSKPYLTSLPDAYAAERLLFDWLEFLVLKGGFKRTMDALRYYRTVGWLTDEVEADLRDYLVGFSGEVSETEAYDVDDHHLSLVYIARLSSMT